MPRIRLLGALYELGRRDNLPELLAYLNHGSWGQRAGAASVVGDARFASAPDWLLAVAALRRRLAIENVQLVRAILEEALERLRGGGR